MEGYFVFRGPAAGWLDSALAGRLIGVGDGVDVAESTHVDSGITGKEVSVQQNRDKAAGEVLCSHRTLTSSTGSIYMSVFLDLKRRPGEATTKTDQA